MAEAVENLRSYLRHHPSSYLHALDALEIRSYLHQPSAENLNLTTIQAS